jgi:hypothetical protein
MFQKEVMELLEKNVTSGTWFILKKESPHVISGNVHRLN